ncbi:hypothetical protein N9164_12565 [Draconibacterium sp.]|nr:hypothetical protein [Draconibacterium sp.]
MNVDQSTMDAETRAQFARHQMQTAQAHATASAAMAAAFVVAVVIASTFGVGLVLWLTDQIYAAGTFWAVGFVFGVLPAFLFVNAITQPGNSK